MNEVSRNRILCVFIFALIICAIFHFVKQQNKQSKYNDELAYYQKQIEDLKEEQNSLLEQKQNMDDSSYIERISSLIKNSILPNLKPAWILSFLVFGEDGEDVLEKSLVILKNFYNLFL